jgi:hypothetical protein
MTNEETWFLFMKGIKKEVIICMIMMSSLNISANDSFYIVKRGDTLTSILYEKKLKPIYGKNGTLAKTLSLNPKLDSSIGNKIFPTMKIILANDVLAISNKSTIDNRQSTIDNQIFHPSTTRLA